MYASSEGNKAEGIKGACNDVFREERAREREREREEGKKEGRRKGQGRSEVPGIKCAVAHCATVVPASGNLARLMQRAALRANDLTSI